MWNKLAHLLGCNCLKYSHISRYSFEVVVVSFLLVVSTTVSASPNPVPPGPPPQSGALSIRDFGAKCDGVTDDTEAIQAAINAARTSATGATILIPDGRAGCIVSQLDITNSLSRIRLVGEASMNGAQSYILCKERLSNVSVCVDFSGTDSFNVENLQIIGGTSAATAPKVTVLLGKTLKSDGSLANGSEITWFSVTVKTNGDYGVYNYGGEVWNCNQCCFFGKEVADVVLSNANSAGITSPFASLVPAPTSMTAVHFNGGTFSTSNSAVAVRLDPWPASGAPISDIGFADGYAHISGPAFIDDTGSPGSQGVIQGVRITGWRTEMYAPAATFAKFNTVVNQITIDAAYSAAHSTVAPLQFNGAWGRYSVTVGDITLRPGDRSDLYPSTVVYCYHGTMGVVVHNFVGPTGLPTHNNCAGAHEM
ncbi:MAG: glycosyl hydrolase family 28-related protein [Candidatus Korobacteraceae bacterium]